MEVLTVLSAPPLLQIAYGYLTIAWKQYCVVQGHREQCSLLISRCQDLLVEIAHIVGQGECPPAIQTNISMLEHACLTVKDTVVQIATKGFAWRLLNQDKMVQAISAAEGSVSDALACFNLGAHLSAQKLQLEINDARRKDHDELIGHLETLAENDQKILHALQSDQRGRHRLEELVVALTKHVRNLSTPTNGLSAEPMDAFILTASATLQRLSNRPAPEIPHWSVTSLEVGFDPDDESTCIGRGGFGKIYKGEWNGQVVAVKEMYSEDAKLLDRQNMKAITHEIKIWSRLAHPHVLPFYCACLEATRPFMVSRFCQNGNALEFLRKVPQADRLLMLHEISLGMVYLHSQSVIHSDLKASNILIGDDAKALIADFGLSYLQEQAANGATRTMASAQRLNGTLRWMAPELLDGEKLEKPADVYSFALLAWELYTGTVPYSHIPERAFARRVVDKQERPERPGSLNSDALWDLIQQCWLPEPGARLVFSAIQAKLRQISYRAQSPTGSAFAAPPPTPTISSRLSGSSSAPTLGSASSVSSSSVDTPATSLTFSPKASSPGTQQKFGQVPFWPAALPTVPQSLETRRDGMPSENASSVVDGDHVTLQQESNSTPSISVVEAPLEKEECPPSNAATAVDIDKQMSDLLEVLDSPPASKTQFSARAPSPNFRSLNKADVPSLIRRAHSDEDLSSSRVMPSARSTALDQSAREDALQTGTPHKPLKISASPSAETYFHDRLARISPSRIMGHRPSGSTSSIAEKRVVKKNLISSPVFVYSTILNDKERAKRLGLPNSTWTASAKTGSRPQDIVHSTTGETSAAARSPASPGGTSPMPARSFVISRPHTADSTEGSTRPQYPALAPALKQTASAPLSQRRYEQDARPPAPRRPPPPPPPPQRLGRGDIGQRRRPSPIIPPPVSKTLPSLISPEADANKASDVGGKTTESPPGSSYKPLNVKKRTQGVSSGTKSESVKLSAHGATRSWVPDPNPSSNAENERLRIRRLQYYLMPSPPEDGSNCVTSVAMNENWIVTGISTGSILVFESKTGKLRRNLPMDGCRDPVVALVSLPRKLDDTLSAMSPRRGMKNEVKDMVVAGGSDKHVRVWCAATGTCLHTLKGHSKAILCIIVVDQLVITGSADESIRIWDLNDPSPEKRCRVLDRHVYRVLCLATWRHWLASGSEDKTVRLWNIEGESNNQIEVFRGHDDMVTCVAIEKNTIVSATASHSVHIYDRLSTRLLRKISLKSIPSRLCLDLPNDFVFVGTEDGTVLKISCSGGDDQHPSTSLDSAVLSMALRGSCIVTGAASGEVRAFDRTTLRHFCDPGALSDDVAVDSSTKQSILGKEGETVDVTSPSIVVPNGESRSLWRFAYHGDRWIFMRKKDSRMMMEIWGEEHALDSE